MISRDWLFLNNFTLDKKVNLQTGRCIVSLDTSDREALLADGDRLPFDWLLIATGASPKLPAVQGVDLAGIFVLRSLDDADAISAWVKPGQKALVLGGWLVGLKAAEALCQRGMKVRIAVSSGRILSQMLDDHGAELVLKQLESKRYEFLLNTEVQEFYGRRQVEGVTLNSGEKLPVDLVVVAKGVDPETSFLQGSGIKLNRGVIVDNFLQTNIPGIYAAGDVAETPDRLQGSFRVKALWGNAVEQGKAAARNMAGYNFAYRGSKSLNSLKIEEVGIISGGIVYPGGEGCVVHACRDEFNKLYRKLVVRHDGTLAGMAAIGFTRGAGTVINLLGRKINRQLTDLFLQGRLDFAAHFKHKSSVW